MKHSGPVQQQPGQQIFCRVAGGGAGGEMLLKILFEDLAGS